MDTVQWRGLSATNKALIASNPVAADATVAFLILLDATRIGHIKVAEQFGLGTGELSRVQFNMSIEEEDFRSLTCTRSVLTTFQLFFQERDSV